MKFAYCVAAAATSLLATAASAATVSNTSLQNINGQFGTSTATTTTTATGTRTTVTGPGPNAAANRAQGTTVFNQWYQANVGAGSTVGITTDYARSGNGSAYFNSTQGDAGKADLVYLFGNAANGAVAPVALSNLTSVSFDFYRSSTSTTDANFAPVMRLDMLKNGAFAGSLVFENVYQQQLASPVDTWTTLTANLNSGIFWATNASLGPTFANANGGQKTLQQWMDDNSGSTLSVYGLEIGIGSGWNGTFFGAVDNVQANFGTARSVNSNFEVNATGAVPEPATWAMMMLGFGGMGYSMRRKANVSTRIKFA